MAKITVEKLCTLNCRCCGNDMPITTAEILNDCIIECKKCKMKYQLHFKYYVKS